MTARPPIQQLLLHLAAGSKQPYSCGFVTRASVITMTRRVVFDGLWALRADLGISHKGADMGWHRGKVDPWILLARSRGYSTWS